MPLGKRARPCAAGVLDAADELAQPALYMLVLQ